MDFKQVEELFKEYHNKTGSDSIGLTVPVGFPCGIQDWEEVAEVYKEFIKRVSHGKNF